MTVDPGVEFLRPLLDIPRSRRRKSRLQPLPDGLKASIHNLVRIANYAGLNCLSDDPLLLRIEVNRHTPYRFCSATIFPTIVGHSAQVNA